MALELFSKSFVAKEKGGGRAHSLLTTLETTETISIDPVPQSSHDNKTILAPFVSSSLLDFPACAMPMFQHMLTTDRRRNSSKISIPGPLVLTEQEIPGQGYLQTPPLTGVDRTSSGKSVKKDVSSSSAHHRPPEMPHTPMTPFSAHYDLARPKSANCLERSKRIACVCEPSPLETTSPEVEALDIAHAKAAESPSSPSIGKRPIEESDTPHPSKRRVLAYADLIENPFVELYRSGVPEVYVRRHILDVTKELFRDPRGACCFIRAKRMSRKNQGQEDDTRHLSLQVRVIPKQDTLRPFNMRFARHPKSADRVHNPAATAAEDTKEESEKKADVAKDDNTAPDDENNDDDDDDDNIDEDGKEECSVLIPLHTEVALLCMPLVGQLLLSGHIFRGDTIEVDVPRPGVFLETLRWMYTGQMRVKDRIEIEQCVALLSGNWSL